MTCGHPYGSRLLTAGRAVGLLLGLGWLAGCAPLLKQGRETGSGSARPAVLAHADTVYVALGTPVAQPAHEGLERVLRVVGGSPEAQRLAAPRALCADSPGTGFWLSREQGHGVEYWQPEAAGAWSMSSVLSDLDAPSLVAASPDGLRLALAWPSPPRFLLCAHDGSDRRDPALSEIRARIAALEFMDDGSLLLADAGGALLHYNTEGVLQRRVEQVGGVPLHGPLDLCRDGMGGVWLLDGLAGCVWHLDGQLASRTAEPVISRLRLPRSLTLDDDGHLLLSVAGEMGLRVHDAKGMLVYHIPARLAGPAPRLVRALGNDRLCVENPDGLRLLGYRPADRAAGWETSREVQP
ncbi:MAG: hypothetical protein KDC10_02010 [Calditrichaeota bacterium]|nr:hypothetical protein [Calditrichota bacterium]